MDVDNNNSDANSNNDQKNNNSNVDQRYQIEFTRAIKENHGHDIVDAAWCPYKGGEAYFATIGANQLNIYDMAVRGNFFSTLLNYRNWHLKTMANRHVVIKENRERHHPRELSNKSFKSICWMKRWRDFWIVVSDNEKQIHIISLTYAQCINIIKFDQNIIKLCAHPKYDNILCCINQNNECKFINVIADADAGADADGNTTGNNRVIYTLNDKITTIRFNKDDTDRFVAVTTNGMIKEYKQSVKYDNDDNKDNDKELVITELNSYKADPNGNNISCIHYCGASRVIFCTESGIFRIINLLISSGELLHQWKVYGSINCGNVCKFEVNLQNECIVYGNRDHQLLIYDINKKKLIRKVDPGRGRKFPFTLATFCRNHPQSVVMISDSVVIKFDPLELVKDYFPSTADFAIQHKNNEQCFTHYKSIKYVAYQ